MSLIPENDKLACFGSLLPRPQAVRKLFSISSENYEDEVIKETETFRVFLRIKPQCNSESKSSIKIVDGTKLICKPPTTSKVYKTSDKSEFTFSKIFGPETTQLEIFDEIVYPCVEDLLNSRNGLVFSYGTTNAGKTYTVQGNKPNPGIIPRALSAIFSKINVNCEVKYAPKRAIDIVRLSLTDRSNTEQQKQDILKLCPKFDKGNTNFFDEYSALMQTASSSFDQALPTCSVWVSFIEMYNENIYDLLDSATNEMSRKVLKLGYDKNNYFVKGLKRVCVRTAEEAYSIYLYGKKNLNVASTRMNESSSRSHCIFVIELINQSDPEFVSITSLSICDLAGTERQTKTQNVGLRLKEAGNINLSLMALNRCLRILRENQQPGSVPQFIPYRSSKLTQLFYSALKDHSDERIVMIVNINSSAELYDETQQVLKMCAIASDIRSKPMKSARVMQRRTRFSTLVYQREEEAFQYQPFELDTFEEEERTNSYTEDYLQELNEIKEKLAKKENTIVELRKTYEKMLEDNTKFHEEETSNLVNEIQESAERRIQSIKDYYEWEIGKIKNGNIEATAEPSQNNSQVEILQEKVKCLELELSKKNDESVPVTRESWTSLMELQKELMAKNETIEDLQSLIEEAKKEFRIVNDDLEIMQLKNQELESEVQSKVDIISCMEQDKDKLEKRLEELEMEVDRYEKLLNDTAVENELIFVGLEKECQKSKQENEELLRRIKALEKERAEQTEKTSEFESEKANLEKELKFKCELIEQISTQHEREISQLVAEKETLIEEKLKAVETCEKQKAEIEDGIRAQEEYKQQIEFMINEQKLADECKSNGPFSEADKENRRTIEEYHECIELSETEIETVKFESQKVEKQKGSITLQINSPKPGDSTMQMNTLSQVLELLTIDEKIEKRSKTYNLRSLGVRSPLQPLSPDVYNRITPQKLRRRSNSLIDLSKHDFEDSADKNVFRSSKKPKAADKENAKKGKKKENKKKLFNTIENENLDLSDRSTELSSCNKVTVVPNMATPLMTIKSCKPSAKGNNTTLFSKF